MAPNPSSAGQIGQARAADAAWRVHPLTVAALGALLLLLATHPVAAPAASTAAPLPAVMLWAQPSRGSQILSGGGIPGAPAHIVIDGRVLAGSDGSITIGGPDHVVTPQLTGATTCNGQAIRGRAVKVGETVTAQIDNSRSHAVVIALREPAWIP
jgi:hypothetical protein